MIPYHLLKRGLVVCTLLVVLSLPAAVAGAGIGQTLNHGRWTDLLQMYVHNGVVDYGGFKVEESKLDRYLDVLATTDPNRLSHDEQFAFFINAYNAWTIKLILTAWPDVQSIKDLGGFLKTPWQKAFVSLNGGTMTLDDIEHRILRPRFKDPRVHFAINCAAVSCPPLRSEAYVGHRIDEQLNDSTRSFLNDSKNYRFEGHQFYISRIFKWFGEDFNDDPLGFYLKFAEEPLKTDLEKSQSDIDIEYLDYNWALNGK